MEDIIYNMIYICPRLLSCEESSESQHGEDFLKVTTRFQCEQELAWFS